jgi:hypothetical protein
VLRAPAPVIADALGFHQTTTTRQRANAGATWSRLPHQPQHPLTGGATAALTVVAGGGWATALLTGAAATDGALTLLNQIIGDNTGSR